MGPMAGASRSLFLSSLLVFLPGAMALLQAGEAGSPPPHWAFVPAEQPEAPQVRDPSWVRNPIDAFVLARLESEGVQPSAQADRSTLIRRLSLDLVGLPPSPEEVEYFLGDSAPKAYERLVDRLLDSPHYGEKWARHWLDLARYADTDGYETDNPRPHAWRWRHWVIEAFNRNLPFDQFTIEQLAGDLLPNPTVEQRVATGFQRNSRTNREGGLDLQDLRIQQVKDRTDTLATVWLGLTFMCASCHDHKYDPISQREYYELYAFFSGAMETDIEAPLPGEAPDYPRRKAEYDRKRQELLTEYNVAEIQADWERKTREASEDPGDEDNPLWLLAWESIANLFPARPYPTAPEWPAGGLSPSFAPFSHEQGKSVTGYNPENVDPSRTYGQDVLRLDPSKRTPKERDHLTDHFLQNYGLAVGNKRYTEVKFRELRKKLKQLRQEYPPLSKAPTLGENPRPPTTHILIRGDFRQAGTEVGAGTPAALPPLSPTRQSAPSRLTLARWLVSPEHPLTARVTVNRLWQELFGRGLVETSENFGIRGHPPTHPELLDWLATGFVAGGWDIKAMLRTMVQSTTYRQSSATRQELQERDPDNKWLARQSRLRLSAELIRDVTLASSGLLNRVVGGKSVYPPQPASSKALSFVAWWKDSEGADRYRRGLYTFFQRTNPYAQLTTFDAPDALNSCSRRARSTIPQQALTLLNDPVFFEAAQGLATRAIRETSGPAPERLDRTFKLCLARDPTKVEKDRLLQYYDWRKDTLREDPEAIQAILPAEGSEGLDPLEVAAWVGVSSIILNLDEFMTRE